MVFTAGEIIGLVVLAAIIVGVAVVLAILDNRMKCASEEAPKKL